MAILIGFIIIANKFSMKKIIQFLCLSLLFACTDKLPDAKEIASTPVIFPDYTDVTIPCNIAPLNFKLNNEVKSIAVLTGINCTVQIKSNNGDFVIPENKWHEMVIQSAGDRIACTIYIYENESWSKYTPFYIHVAKDSIDPNLVYRKIAPGYRMWGKMGIYQRNLESFEEEEILSNRLTNNNCMNCHSFCMQNPDMMLFHQRSLHGATYIIKNGKMEKLNTKTQELMSALVYPFWHPSGRYAAFSVNDTKQDFHHVDANRVEVFDSASDVVVYDMDKHEIVTDSLLLSEDNLETFPAFSPDGKTLYFCSASAKPMPESFREVKYSLLALSFDPEKRTFGEKADTLYNATEMGKSARFPRVSPNGRYVLFTVSDYGNFSIWHKDADLQMIDLATNELISLDAVNSDDVESYHSWSSNSHWFVFSSRRDDGLYTRPYIVHVDEKGVTGKPFLLPQKSNDYYDDLLFSFNIPELVKGKVNIDTYELVQLSKYGEAQSLKLSK